MNQNNPIVLIYDGECRFCKTSVDWCQQKLKVQALPFQSSDLSSFGLTSQQCVQQVYVIAAGKTYAGAAGVALLLQARGNTFLAGLINTSGPIGRFGYRWVASHRNSRVVKVIKFMLDRSNAKHRIH